MERLYLDTSVFGGYFDSEFELWSKILFDKIRKGEMKMLFSELTQIELQGAPQHVKDLVKTIPIEHVEFLILNNDVNILANCYINENVVGKTNFEDCRHIAIATLNNADVLASWNYKHIVSLKRIRGYNSVNYKYGHKMLEIRGVSQI